MRSMRRKKPLADIFWNSAHDRDDRQTSATPASASTVATVHRRRHAVVMPSAAATSTATHLRCGGGHQSTTGSVLLASSFLLTILLVLSNQVHLVVCSPPPPPQVKHHSHATRSSNPLATHQDDTTTTIATTRSNATLLILSLSNIVLNTNNNNNNNNNNHININNQTHNTFQAKPSTSTQHSHQQQHHLNHHNQQQQHNHNSHYSNESSSIFGEVVTAAAAAATSPEWNHPLIGVVLFLIPVVAVCGNAMVIYAVVREDYLKSPNNYYIASLACADLLVGLLVIPFNSLNQMTNDYWFFGDVWCDIWHSMDVFGSTASINSLLFIALDRHSAISDPFNYHRSPLTRYWLAFVALIWIGSACISFPVIAFWMPASGAADHAPNSCVFPDDIIYLVFSSLVSFYIPLLVMIVVYMRIYRVAIRQMYALKTGRKLNCRLADGTELTLRIHRGGYHKIDTHNAAAAAASAAAVVAATGAATGGGAVSATTGEDQAATATATGDNETRAMNADENKSPGTIASDDLKMERPVIALVSDAKNEDKASLLEVDAENTRCVQRASDASENRPHFVDEEAEDDECTAGSGDDNNNEKLQLLAPTASVTNNTTNNSNESPNELRVIKNSSRLADRRTANGTSLTIDTTLVSAGNSNCSNARPQNHHPNHRHHHNLGISVASSHVDTSPTPPPLPHSAAVIANANSASATSNNTTNMTNMASYEASFRSCSSLSLNDLSAIGFLYYPSYIARKRNSAAPLSSPTYERLVQSFYMPNLEQLQQVSDSDAMPDAGACVREKVEKSRDDAKFVLVRNRTNNNTKNSHASRHAQQHQRNMKVIRKKKPQSLHQQPQQQQQQQAPNPAAAAEQHSATNSNGSNSLSTVDKQATVVKLAATLANGNVQLAADAEADNNNNNNNSTTATALVQPALADNNNNNSTNNNTNKNTRHSYGSSGGGYIRRVALFNIFMFMRTKKTSTCSSTTTTTSQPMLQQHQQQHRRSSTAVNQVKQGGFSLCHKLSKFSREQKAAKTLGIVMSVFIICWLPFFVYNVTSGLFRSVGSPIVYAVLTWLGYMNSLANPIIYTLTSANFRRAFAKYLCARGNASRHMSGAGVGGGGNGGNGGPYAAGIAVRSNSKSMPIGVPNDLNNNSNANGGGTGNSTVQRDPFSSYSALNKINTSV